MEYDGHNDWTLLEVYPQFSIFSVKWPKKLQVDLVYTLDDSDEWTFLLKRGYNGVSQNLFVTPISLSAYSKTGIKESNTFLYQITKHQNIESKTCYNFIFSKNTKIAEH